MQEVVRTKPQQKRLNRLSKLIEEAQKMADRMENRLIEYKDFCDGHRIDVDKHFDAMKELKREMRNLMEHRGKYKR
jgi:hypothetical protein